MIIRHHPINYVSVGGRESPSNSTSFTYCLKKQATLLFTAMDKIVLKYNNGSVPPQYSVFWQLTINSGGRGTLVYSSEGSKESKRDFEVPSFPWRTYWDAIETMKTDDIPDNMVGGPQYFLILIKNGEEVVNKLITEPNNLWNEILSSMPTHISEKITADD